MAEEAVSIGILGAGAWGTTLAILARRAGSNVKLWTRNMNVLESITENRTNDIYLPDVFIDPAIEVTDDISRASDKDIILLCVPSQHIRATCILLSDKIATSVPIVIATKGIERGSLSLMSEVVQSVVPHNPLVVLTGPNFAYEAAKGLPTATSIACADEKIGNSILYALGGKYFRPYLTDDLIGAQIGGAVKNVIAIACGIALGRGFGENARAALITRGLAEIGRLCAAKGGRQQTLMGLSGLGDLVLTCGSTTSRNMHLGLLIGQGKPVAELISGSFKGLAEGIVTSESVAELAEKLGVSMPICRMVRDVLYANADIDKSIQSLMERPFVSEALQTSL